MPSSAEAARRDGDTGTVYANYSELARSYQEANDAKTGIYFFEKCLEIARLTGDPVGEMHANHNLGLAYQRLNNMDMAIQYHALHRDLVLRGREALASGDGIAPDDETLEGELRTASYELNKMYRSKAEHLEGQEKVGEAIELYRSGLVAAENTANAETVGQANYRLGRALILVGESQSAVNYLNVYLESSLDSGNVAAQGQAYSALAAAHQALGSTEDAVSCLQQYLKIAKKTDDLTAQAEACCNLGVIHNRRGEYKKAVHFFADYWNGEGTWDSYSLDQKAKFSEVLKPNYHEWDAVLNETTPIEELYKRLPADTTFLSALDTVFSIKELKKLFMSSCPSWNFKTIKSGGHMALIKELDQVAPIILRSLLGEQKS